MYAAAGACEDPPSITSFSSELILKKLLVLESFSAWLLTLAPRGVQGLVRWLDE